MEVRRGNPFELLQSAHFQRSTLPNGNTLVNDGWFGCFFEVTLDGEVVWEYVNPYFGPASEPANAQNNNVFRVYRYTEKEIARARMTI